jgi:polysaccharide export outer membrane protein
VKPNTVRVTVLGEVVRPDTYELHDDAGLAQALAAAGGLTAAADATAATLTRDGLRHTVNISVPDLNAQLSPLADGDVIYVPELEFRILALGQVARPGAYDLKPGAKLLDLISAAGGTLNGADEVEIYSADDSTDPYFEGLLSVNPTLNPGDTVIVKPNTVRVAVLGEVARPGTYELRKDAGLAQALAAAGGLTPDADGATATLTRDGDSLTVNLTATDLNAQLTYLADGDVISIPKREFRGLVMGQVARPGAYDLMPGAKLLEGLRQVSCTVDQARSG